MLVPILIVWVSFRDNENDVVYRDESIRIELATWTSMISETTNTQITLYQYRAWLFEQRIGFLHAGLSGPNADKYVDFYTKQGWATINRVIVDPDSLKGVAQNQLREYPFVITKPYSGESAPPSLTAAPVEAPPPPVNGNRVYNYVDEMPHMPGRRGVAPIERAIMSRLVLPRDVQEGRVFLRLEVDTAGGVRNLHIENGLNASTDSAVLAAARQLPRLIPGQQNGRPVVVRMTLVDILVAKPKARQDRTVKQLTYAPLTANLNVDHLPQLPGGGPQALEEALVRNFHYPAGVQPSQVNGTLYVDAVVNRAGKVTTIKLVRYDGLKKHHVALYKGIRAALYQLPPLVPARLHGQPVTATLHIDWAFLLNLPDGDTHMRVTIEQPIKESYSAGVDF
ncbi:energy transducer TonB [Hymenobacter cavernae]|uniref:energy transducer TonB n=1 Tax=Hymenobacter cavernae TaxID=2044852 RepID=UPI00166EB202|nr:energy transducer TonB [Hymenobacter cavernae]